MTIPKLRWQYKNSKVKSFRPIRYIFELEDGTEFTVIGPNSAIAAVTDLPYDYLALGHKAADDIESVHGKKRQYKAIAEEAAEEIKMLRQRIDAAPEADQIVPILCEDLEKSINMMMRFAQSLGIMAQGPIYEDIQALATKYGMSYREPNGKQIRAEAYERDILGADILEAEFNPVTGRLEFDPAPGATIEGTARSLELPSGEESDAID